MKMTPNQGLEGSAQQRARCWVPSSLRSSAPPQPQRWASGALCIVGKFGKGEKG